MRFSRDKAASNAACALDSSSGEGISFNLEMEAKFADCFSTGEFFNGEVVFDLNPKCSFLGETPKAEALVGAGAGDVVDVVDDNG